MKKIIGLLFTLMFLCSGCAPMAPKVVSKSEQHAKTFLPKSGYANLYVYLASANNAVETEHTVDGIKVGKLKNESFFLLEVPAGNHTVHSKVTTGFKNPEYTVEVEITSGNNYFVRNSGLISFNVELVDEIIGKKDVAPMEMIPVPKSIVRSIAAEFQPAVQQNIEARPIKPKQAPTERLVLMPLRVDDDSNKLQGAMETALVQGLQQNYIVFSGEQVAQKAREIFLKESRSSTKKECDETRCMQGIAEAFQAELIATANVTKQDGGYFMALSIQNIFDNKVVYSNSVPCKNCDSFQVVAKLKELSSQ